MRTDPRARNRAEQARARAEEQARSRAQEQARTRAEAQARIRAEAQARVEAHLQLGREMASQTLHAAGQTLHAATHTFNQTRPGMLVQQYRGSEFHDRTKRAVRARFRIPLEEDPAPEPRRLMTVSVWAGVLGLIGVVVAMPVLASLFRPDSGWYTPVMLLIGLVGVSATAGAFASIHRRRAPWIGLWVGTAALLLAILVTVIR